MLAELVADAHCQIAEGPVWHPDEQKVYWTDIPASRIYCFDPASGAHEIVHEDSPVGGMTVQGDGSLLLLGTRGSVKVWRDGHLTGTILTDIPGERDTRFNDAIADPEGRVFSGTMATRDINGGIHRYGNLYCLEPDGQYRKRLDGTGSPNGMGFTPDLRHLYFTESIVGTQSIYRLDYDRITGSLENRRLFYQTALDGSAGRPDGMTVDMAGCVWTALWDGGAVVRVRPDSTEEARFPLPVPKVTSVTFGGPDYTDLYITTARDTVEGQQQAGTGGLFRLPGAGQGRPEFRSNVALK